MARSNHPRRHGRISQALGLEISLSGAEGPQILHASRPLHGVRTDHPLSYPGTDITSVCIQHRRPELRLCTLPTHHHRRLRLLLNTRPAALHPSIRLRVFLHNSRRLLIRPCARPRAVHPRRIRHRSRGLRYTPHDDDARRRLRGHFNRCVWAVPCSCVSACVGGRECGWRYQAWCCYRHGHWHWQFGRVGALTLCIAVSADRTLSVKHRLVVHLQATRQPPVSAWTLSRHRLPLRCVSYLPHLRHRLRI